MSAATVAPARAATGSAWGTALTASAATCVAVATVYMTQPVFPEVAADLRVPAPDVRFAFTVASFAYALSFFLFGPLTDRVSGRAMASGGAAAVAGLAALAAFAPGFAALAALLAAAGVAAAAVPSATIALMPKLAPPGLTGTFFGLMIGASVAGIALGRSMTGVIAEAADWRVAFGTLAALNLLSALGLLALLPRTDPGAGGSGPVRDAYAAALGLFRQATVVRLLAVGTALFFGYLGVATMLTYRLQEAPFHYSAGAIGAVSLIGLVGVLGAPAAGRLTALTAARNVVLIGLALVLGGIALLGLAGGPVALAAGMLLLFLGVFSCQPAVLVMLAAEAGPERRGSASSLYMLVCLLAGSVASAAFGPVWTGGGWAAVAWTGTGAVVLAAVLAAIGPRSPD